MRLTSAPGLRSQSGQDPSQLRRGDSDTLQPFRHLRRCCNSCSYSATAARSQETTTDERCARSPPSHPLPRPLRPPPALLPNRRWPRWEEKHSDTSVGKTRNVSLGEGGELCACAEEVSWEGELRLELEARRL